MGVDETPSLAAGKVEEQLSKDGGGKRWAGVERKVVSLRHVALYWVP